MGCSSSSMIKPPVGHETPDHHQEGGMGKPGSLVSAHGGSRPTDNHAPKHPDDEIDTANKMVNEKVNLEDYFPSDPLRADTLKDIERYQESQVVKLPKVRSYQGEWVLGRQHGVGKMIYHDRACYEGYWKEGRAHGFGKYISGEGSAMAGSDYIGTFQHGKACGYGVFNFSDGSVYNGLFRADKRHGLGLERHSDNLQYIGPYKLGKKNGIGRLKSANGELYIGEFKDNEISGYGVYLWRDGRCYEGYWNRSVQEGSARFTWPDARVYVGDYTNGKINGRGVLIWPDGRRYDGEWKNGLQEGVGMYYKNERSYRTATFLEGVRTRWMTNFVELQEPAPTPIHEIPDEFKHLDVTSVEAMDKFLLDHFKKNYNLEELYQAVKAGIRVDSEGLTMSMQSDSCTKDDDSLLYSIEAGLVV